MKRGAIGVMLSTVTDKIAEIGVYETLKTCVELGYHYVEVSQIPMTAENVSEMKRACEDFDLKIAALSASLEPMIPGMEEECLEQDFDKIVEDCKALDCHILRMGMMPVNYIGSYEKTLEFARRADAMAVRLKEQGIDLYLHNHNSDFVKYEGKYMLDIVKENTKYLGFELDIYWIQAGGEYPVEFIKKYAGRIRLLHLKDYRIVDVKVPKPFDFNQFWVAFEKVAQYAEVGEGNLPVKECVEAGLAGGSEYFLIEQDDTYGRDTFESLKISRDHLIEMGFGDWFE